MRSIKAIAALAIVLSAGLTGCMRVVNDGNVGVQKFWGKYDDKPFAPGSYWYFPFGTEWAEVSTRLDSFPVQATAVSKDIQQANTTATVTFSVSPLGAAVLLRNAGVVQEAIKNIMEPAAQQGIKTITARYTANELVTQREKARAEIEETIRGYVDYVLNSKGMKDAILIQTVAITDFQFSRKFIDNIEATIAAQQEAMRAEVEKKKRITNAEAEAAETTLQAEARAKAITMEATAKAEAIKVEADALKDNPGLLELRAIERWSGEMPSYIGGGGQLPFINLPAPSSPKKNEESQKQ
jgi:prohibitin 2